MTGFVLARAWSIAKKEVRHVLRDPFTLTLALGLPVVMIVFFGYAIDFTVKNVRIAVVDHDRTPASRDLQNVFSSSDYFRIVSSDGRDGIDLIDNENTKAALYIPPGFQTQLTKGGSALAQVVLDGADNQTTGIIASYLGGLQRAANDKLAGTTPVPVRLETRFLFNSELNSRWFIVPGLSVVVIGILSILLTALTVAREWENGSMELLLSTPVRPLEIVIGKLFPYSVLGLLSLAFVYGAARLVFGVPFRGSHLLFVATGLVFLTTVLAQGLLISVVTRQQLLAMQLANISGMMPNLLLSGFIFPIESMPIFFQRLTMGLAPRWFMFIVRGLFLKGASLFDLGVPILALCLINVGIVTLAVRKFKTDLEP